MCRVLFLKCMYGLLLVWFAQCCVCLCLAFLVCVTFVVVCFLSVFGCVLKDIFLCMCILFFYLCCVCLFVYFVCVVLSGVVICMCVYGLLRVFCLCVCFRFVAFLCFVCVVVFSCKRVFCVFVVLRSVYV